MLIMQDSLTRLKKYYPSTSQYDIILTGDYNINWYHNTREKNNLIQLIANLDMMQVINGTTHVGLSQESCIDLIFAPNKLSACSHGIIFNHMHNGIIWHNFTYISIKISPNRAPRKIIKQRNFTNFDPEMMLADAMNMHLNIQPLDSASVDEIAEGLESKITALVDKHAPFKSVRVRPTRKP